MPVLDGLLSDCFLGRTRTILLGRGLMTIGHFLLLFDASFLIGLTCLIAGVGCSFCLQAQVGADHPALPEACPGSSADAP